MTRDFGFGSLRGGLLNLAITFAHIGSPFSKLYYEFFGRVNPAAGFFFISGLVAGAVYGRVATKGWQGLITKATKRAFYVHGYYVCNFLFLLTVAACVPDSNQYWHFSFKDSTIFPFNMAYPLL